MSKERTEDSKYKSPNSGEFCSSQQYLAEIMMTRRYETIKKKRLPDKFWNLPQYKKEFIQGIIAANRLVKIYNPDILIKVLLTTGKHIYSLWSKDIDRLVSEEELRISSETSKFELEIANPNKLPESHGKQTSLGKLRE